MADLHEYAAGPVATSIIEFYAKKGAPAATQLEASTVGGACDRALWFALRMCSRPESDGRAVRLMDTDRRAKERLVSDLCAAGVEVQGSHHVFTDHGGHLQGVMDAATHQVPSGGDQWHATEFATLDEHTFARLSEKGVEAVCYGAYDKLQLIMGWSGMTRALYLAENRSDSSLFAERVPFDPVYFERLRARAESVIFAVEAPPRLYEDPTEEECRACPSHYACHGMRVPAISCRTCCYATPERDGDARWSCCHRSRLADTIPIELQQTGCEDHLYLPFLVNYANVVEAGASGWVLFRRHDNGRHFVVASATAMPPADMFAAYDAPALYHSTELAAAHDHRDIGGRAVA